MFYKRLKYKVKDTRCFECSFQIRHAEVKPINNLCLFIHSWTGSNRMWKTKNQISTPRLHCQAKYTNIKLPLAPEKNKQTLLGVHKKHYSWQCIGNTSSYLQTSLGFTKSTRYTGMKNIYL